MLLVACASCPAASALEPERDARLSSGGAALRADARRVYTPLEFDQIQATGNDVAPEYAAGARSELILSAATGDRVRVEALLAQGVNPNARPDPWGKTALIHAVERGDTEIVRGLLNAGADPDLKAGGYTPLGMAAIQGHAWLVDMLLRRGADPDLKSSDGNTPLTAAVSLNRVDAVRGLLRARPDLTLYNLEGRTALGLAAKEGFEEIVRLLLEAGADANMLDKNGGRPLASAGLKDNAAIREMLIKHGANSE